MRAEVTMPNLGYDMEQGKITQWLKLNPGVQIVDKIVTQSSDEAFHCLAITLFYNDPTKV